MRYSLVIVFISWITFTMAQYLEKEEGLISRFRPGIGWYYSGFKPYEETKLRKYDRLIIDLVYNDWMGDRKIFQSPWNSLGYNVSLMFDKVISSQNTFSIGYGLTFSHYNNKTDKDFVRDYSEGSTLLVDFDENTDFVRNKFTANYIELPVEFRFRTKGRKHFKFLIGGKIGYQLNSFTQQVISNDGARLNSRNYSFPDINPLRYGATVRFGLRNYAVFAAYHFSPLFRDVESVHLNPISVGLSLSLF
jgi:hypothetical protein